MPKSSLLRRVLRWVPATVWYGIIWFFSSQTGEESGDVSKHVLTDALHFDIYSISWDFYQLLTFLVRKAGHMFIFFVLTACLWYGFRGITKKAKWLALGPALGCLVLAAGDELHQFFVPGRSCMARDVVIDFLGGAVFLLGWWLVHLIRAKRAAKQEKA